MSHQNEISKRPAREWIVSNKRKDEVRVVVCGVLCLSILKNILVIHTLKRKVEVYDTFLHVCR